MYFLFSYLDVIWVGIISQLILVWIIRSAVINEYCSKVRHEAAQEMRPEAPRSRLAGAGFKPP